MDGSLILQFVMRWTHMVAAILLMGGAIHLRQSVLPALKTLPEDQQNAFKAEMTQRWKKWVMAGIGLLLISGFYNYLVVQAPAQSGYKLYHPLMGTKILLAFVVFFFASAFVGRSPKLQPLRTNANYWLGVTLLLALVIVGIGSFLKTAAKAPSLPPPSAPVYG